MDFLLRPPHLEDVLPYARYLADPAVAIWLDDTAQRPLSPARVEAVLLREAWCLWVVEVAGTLAGVSSLYDPNQATNTARLSIVIGESNLWGNGLGLAVVRQVLDHGFRALGLRKINSDILEPNIGALRIHERAGFVEEGRLRQDAWRDGHWVDRVLLSITREEYITRTKAPCSPEADQ